MKREERQLVKEKNCTYPNLDSAAAGWLQATADVCKLSTFMNYTSIYNRRISPVIGQKDILLITRDDVRLVIFDNPVLNGARPSANFARKTYRELVRIIIFSEADVDIEELTHGLVLPPEKKKPIDTYTLEEQRKIYKILTTDIDSSKLGILFCLLTGCRLGEACSLKTSDISIENATAYIHKTVQRIRRPDKGKIEGEIVSTRARKTVLIVTDPKTETSNRFVPLQDNLLQLLKEHMPDTEYLINGSNVMDPRTYEYRFRKYQEKAGINPRKFHVLRHTFATNCIAGGMSPKVLSDILGHANITTTMNLYVHPTMDTKKDQLNKAFGSLHIDLE